MNKILAILGLGLWLAFAFQAFASNDNANHYSAKANAWVEGTLTKATSDGSFGVRGAESPYARDYASFHREFFGYAPLERNAHRNDLLTVYSDRLKYAPEKLNAPKDFAFTGGNLENVAIFEEPQFGRETSSWSYRAEPRPFRFDELRMGDRVVVGYDSYDSSVFTIYLINPIRSDEIKINAAPPPELPRAAPFPPNIDPVTGLHVMNESSNQQRNPASKSGSDSGHIMNSGSNSTNQPPFNPFGKQ